MPRSVEDIEAVAPVAKNAKAIIVAATDLVLVDMLLMGFPLWIKLGCYVIYVTMMDYFCQWRWHKIVCLKENVEALLIPR